MIDIKQNIYIDFDGVIVNTISAIVRLYNEDFSYYENYRYIYPTTINTYNFSECACASKKNIDTYFNTPRFFENLYPIGDALSSIQELNKHFSVYIVSLGHSPNLLLKKNWVYWRLPDEVKFIGINLQQFKDKSCVDMSGGIFIDDKLSNHETSNAKYKILFGKEYEWNKGYDPEKIYRCYTWKDVMETINRITGVIK